MRRFSGRYSGRLGGRLTLVGRGQLFALPEMAPLMSTPLDACLGELEMAPLMSQPLDACLGEQSRIPFLAQNRDPLPAPMCTRQPLGDHASGPSSGAAH
eukprot:3471133-Prymnesium_polylepis.1